MTRALQRSRERLVGAREEERRRLRRDLHDGLGPALAGIALKLDVSRNLLKRDPVAVEATLVQLRDEAQRAIADIRRVVYDLRPPALDDLGLLGALREHVERLDGDVRYSLDLPERLPALPELQPDVVVMDLQMPAVNGIEATRRIVEARPHIGVLVLTMFEDDDSVFAAMRASARSYLLKGSAQDEIVRAIHAVASGEAIFGPAIAQRLMDFFASEPSGPPPPAFPDLRANCPALPGGGFDPGLTGPNNAQVTHT